MDVIRESTETMTDFLYKAIRDAGMSDSPGYYSGRGATTSDLGYRQLNTIAKAIKENKGDKALKNFVHMVAQIDVLSATDFLLTLQQLAAADWVWNKKMLPRTKGIHVDSIGAAFGTIGEVFGRSQPPRDSTVEIRAQFLREHGVPEPKPGGAYGDHNIKRMVDQHEWDNFRRSRGIK